VEQLSRAGFEAVHWSNVGDPRAPDRTLMLVDDGLDAQHRALLVVHLDPVALHAVLEAPTGQAPRELGKIELVGDEIPLEVPIELAAEERHHVACLEVEGAVLPDFVCVLQERDTRPRERGSEP
jgi:hypothetical protein